ncbi:MAG TPA: hypothetical protein QF555_06770 [Candidatus Thalassarchaeaceae archaeon]|jgi:hypothetical protein|nr:hypothetical protein [Candidatus Thalassarchaeaceae archaeon]
MFGMDDPSKVVEQIRNYIAEGRLELAEVMAQELSTHLLNSKRNNDLDRTLVLVLREWTLVLFIKEQWKEARAASLRLSKARRIEIRRLRSLGDVDALSSGLQLEIEDLVLHGRIESSRGRFRASRKWFSTAIKRDPNHIEARLSRIGSRWRIRGSLKGGNSDVKDLLKTLDRSAGVERIGGVLGMRISESSLVSTDRILEIIEGCCDSSLGLSTIVVERSQILKERILSEINQIQSGERESNARLAAAIDSLTPSLDYHKYSSS